MAASIEKKLDAMSLESEFVTEAISIPEWNRNVLERDLPELVPWPKGVIVAGGALVTWTFERTPLQPVRHFLQGVVESPSDIDLWVFDRQVLQGLVALFEKDPKNQMVIHRRSVKITRPGIAKPVQIIYWPKRTPEDLVEDFDIDAVRAYTDGIHRYMHTTCVKAWQKKTVFDCHTPIAGYRISKMFAKGFQVELPDTVKVDFMILPAWEESPETEPLTPDRLMLLADTIDSIDIDPNDEMWQNYHGRGRINRQLVKPMDFTFDTTVKFLGKPFSIGVTEVPSYVENALQSGFLLMHFLNLAPSVPFPTLGPVRLTVRIYGFSVTPPNFTGLRSRGIVRVIKCEQK